MDCGPACLRMIAKYYDKNFDLHQMKNISRICLEGSSMLDLMKAAKKIGISSKGLKIDIESLGLINLPVILHWDNRHFVVLFKIQTGFYFIADPAFGIIEFSKSDFLSHWTNYETNIPYNGVVLSFSVTG